MRDEQPPYQKQIGSHSIRFEPPDLYVTTFIGEISGAEMMERNAEVARFAAGKPFVLGLADIRRGIMTPDARRAATGLTKLSRGTAFVCLEPKQQLSLSILATARESIQSGATDSPLGFFATEPEAREWIAERRMALQALEEAL